MLILSIIVNCAVFGMVLYVLMNLSRLIKLVEILQVNQTREFERLQPIATAYMPQKTISPPTPPQAEKNIDEWRNLYDVDGSV